MSWRDDWPIRLLQAALSGSAAAAFDQALRGGTFFGWILFEGLSSGLTVRFVDQHHLSEAYPGWAGSVVPQAVGAAGVNASAWFWSALAFAAVFFFVLLAHVLYKRHLADQGPPLGGQRLADCLRRLFRRGTPLTSRWNELCRVYRCGYFFFTWVLLLATVAVMVAVDEARVWMILLFVILALPAFLYLIVYPRDLFRGQLREQFTYVVVIIVVLFGILTMPYLYGRRFFDAELPVADSATLPDGSTRLLRETGEETMVFDAERVVLGTLRQQGDRLVVQFWRAEHADYDGIDTRRLRSLGDGFEMADEEAGRSAAAFRSWLDEFGQGLQG